MTTSQSCVRADRGDEEALFNLTQRLLDQETLSCQDRCDKCKKYLNGAVHEGYLCYDCGWQAHKACNAPSYSSVLEQFTKTSLFGLGLHALFDPAERPAPYVVMRLTQEIELKARNLHQFDVNSVYLKSVSSSVKPLKHKLSEDICSVELNQYDIEIIAGVLKNFLWELPDPVIPSAFYQDFVSAALCVNDGQCAEALLNLVASLPNHHQLTLRFLLGHLIRLCQLHHALDPQQPPISLVPVFALLLLRPAWHEIQCVVANIQAHVRILELLLLHGDWGEKLPEVMSAPALPPRKVSRPSPGPDLAELDRSCLALKEAEWYWGDITRDEVNEKLMNTPDGTFLVRNASSKGGEYTLTLRKGGTNKLIKICHKNGMYGFSEPYKFTSVVDLVNFYRKSSLAQYNAALDIKLKKPVSRFQQEDEIGLTFNVEKVAARLAELSALYRDRMRAFTKIKDDVSRLEKEIEVKQGPTSNAFNELTKMFKEQLEHQEKLKKDAKPQELNNLQMNCDLLYQKISALEESQVMLEDNLKQQVAFLKTMEREMLNMNLEVQNLHKQKEQHIRWLRVKGIKQSAIEQIMAPEGKGRLKELEPDTELMPHQTEALWLLQDCSRNEATLLLEGKPDGTFLVRPSALGPHALSIVCNGVVNHCIISKTERGYGFAEPYNIYSTLKELVLHYATNSLEEHNEELQTCLLYPVYAVQGTSGCREMNAVATRLGYL